MIYRSGPYKHTDDSGQEWFIDQRVSREVLNVLARLIAAERLTTMGVCSIEITGETPPAIKRTPRFFAPTPDVEPAP